MISCYLSIGSNIGDRIANLQGAIDGLRTHNIEIERISSVYETEPVGGVVQDDFLNLAVKIKTNLTAYDLLNKLHDIEQQLHRKRIIHWGPRTIDLDILYYANKTFDDAELKIPHPEIKNRQFVLIPLLDIVDDELKIKVQQMLKETSDKNKVIKTNQFGGIK